MRFSVSRVGCFESCRYQFKLRYLDELETLPNYDDPQNALYLGSALHKGIETTVEEGIKLYYDSYPVISDLHINEAMKLAYWIPKVKELLPENAEHEVRIELGEQFIGFIDLLVKNENGTYDIYDFKYSNNVDHYMESPQLHVYKQYFECVTHHKVNKLFFVFVPKVNIRQKKTETVQTFRTRLMEELEKKRVEIREVPYDVKKVIRYFDCIADINACRNFKKNETRLCDWCEFQMYCKEGIDYMLLPSTERRKPESVKRTRIWVYGAPFSGKTTLADRFPTPLMLNTDGNIGYVTAPYLPMKDIVEANGRITTTTLAWEVFKDAVKELAKKQNDFKTIVVDLVEDLYESCRLYMYKQMGISHESDDSFKAWDKVRTEFLSTMRELMNLDYDNIILISHEDTSKDITKRTGDKISSVRPNIAEKVANKLAGMVDVVIRCVVIDGKHLLSFKTDEVVFGGGRLNLKAEEIPNDYDTLMDLIHPERKDDAQPTLFDEPKEETITAYAAPVDNPEDVQKVTAPKELFEAPKKRERKARNAEASKTEAQQKADEKTVEELTGLEESVDCSQDTPPEEAPAPRRRRRRSAESDDNTPF